jgi:SAM-dependent methyltransferase/Tfp pilus assembly protein PilF
VTPGTDAFERALAAHREGRLEEAERLYGDALTAAPNHGPATNNLGILLATGGRPAEAVTMFQRATAIDPASADAWANLAQACESSGRTDEALAAWRRAAALLPRAMEPALAAGLLCLRLGRMDEGTTLMREAARREPGRPESRATLLEHIEALPQARVRTGGLAVAHELASTLLDLDPAHVAGAQIVAWCLRTARLQRFDQGVKRDLLRCFASDAVDHRELARVSAESLRLEHAALRTEGEPDAVLDAVCRAGVHVDPLLLALLSSAVNADPALERTLTALRRALLERVAAQAPLDGGHQVLLAALALQSFNNDYAFAVTPGEEQGVDALAGSLETQTAPWDATRVAALAAYRAPYRLVNAADIATDLESVANAPGAPAWLGDFARRTLLEPLAEQALRRAIEAEPIDDETSRAVRDQYEHSPYPRWLTLQPQPPASVAQYMQGMVEGWKPPPVLAGPVSILIAGCGTGMHALRVATRHPDCRVTAIDLSAASLAYALRKQRELGVDNLVLRQADLLALDPTLTGFHLIESVGVLHHLRDPAAGLAAITGRLAPDGVIKIGLYSRLARRNVNSARARIRELGLQPTAADMRLLRERILSGAEPALQEVVQSLDFYGLSTVRDLLFHVQEHQFDLPELGILLAGVGLEVLGFQVAPGVARRYRARHPDDPRMASLTNWHAFEKEHPNTFSGMYQLYCVRAAQP